MALWFTAGTVDRSGRQPRRYPPPAYGSSDGRPPANAGVMRAGSTSVPTPSRSLTLPTALSAASVATRRSNARPQSRTFPTVCALLNQRESALRRAGWQPSWRHSDASKAGREPPRPAVPTGAAVRVLGQPLRPPSIENVCDVTIRLAVGKEHNRRGQRAPSCVGDEVRRALVAPPCGHVWRSRTRGRS
jgi:hypothetical protein